MTSDAVRLPLIVGVIIGGDGDWTLAASREISRFQGILRDEAERVGFEGYPGVQIVFTIPGNKYNAHAREGVGRYVADSNCVVYHAAVPQGMACEKLGAFVIERLKEALPNAEKVVRRRGLPSDFDPARTILERLVQP